VFKISFFSLAFVKEFDMESKIAINKSVPRERWGEFFDQFSDGNRGRHIFIEIIDSELGDEELVHDAPLMAIIYDRPGKGDDLVIEVGKDQVFYAHTVNAPTEVLTAHNSLGEIVAIYISDVSETRTLIKLKTS
jgi:hypothetical protein